MHNTIRHISLTKLVALALLTLCIALPSVGARATGPTNAWTTTTDADRRPSAAPTPVSRQRYADVPPFGVVFGQTLRLTVAHADRGTGQEKPPPNINVGVWILDSSGRVIAQSASAQIPLNEFRSFDFDRAALTLPGEAGTGRLQVRARLVMNVAEPYRFTDDPDGTSLLVPSLELIDNSTGRTAIALLPAVQAAREARRGTSSP